MAMGNNRHYRIKEIQPRHFYQTGQKTGLRKQDMDDLFSELVSQLDDALEKVEKLGIKAGAPKLTLESILAGVKKRAGLIECGIQSA